MLEAVKSCLYITQLTLTSHLFQIIIILYHNLPGFLDVFLQYL